MQGKEDNDSCQTKYAVPSFYDIYRSGGSTLKDNNRGMSPRGKSDAEEARRPPAGSLGFFSETRK